MKRFSHSLAPVDSISTLDEMLIHSDNAVEDGEMVWVRGVRCAFVYRVNSGLTPDGISVVGSTFGAGVWVRLTETSDPSWLLQPTWFIDPVSGNDANSGLTAGAALKTDAERQRRWGKTALINRSVTVTYLSDLGDSDPVNYDARMGQLGSLSILGAMVTVKSGSINAVTVLDETTQTPWSATSTPAFDGTEVGHFLQISSGANVGDYAVVAKDNGAGSLRLSQPGIPDATSPSFVGGAVAHGDSYDLLMPVSVPIGSWRFEAMSDVDTRNTAVVVDGLTLNATDSSGMGVGSIVANNVCVVTERCILNSLWFAGGVSFSPYLLGSCIIGSTVLASGSVVVESGAAIDGTITFNPESNAVLDLDLLCQAAHIIVNGRVTFGRLAVFDYPGTEAIRIEARATVLSRPFASGNDLIWGDGNSNLAVLVRSGGMLIYSTKPTCNVGLGIGRETMIGGNDKAWASVPFADIGATASQAAIVHFD